MKRVVFLCGPQYQCRRADVMFVGWQQADLCSGFMCVNKIRIVLLLYGHVEWLMALDKLVVQC